MQNIFHTAREWLTRIIRRVKGLIWNSNFLVSLLAAILFGLVVVIVIVLSTPSPEWIYPTLGLSQKNDVLRFLGFGIGGTLLALSAVISYKRAKAFEDTAQNQEKGLRQERLKNAIKHLADRSASVRLGGAYELFHLAKDTRALDQTEDLSQTALDILCAHIRQTTREAEYIQKYRSEPSEEIQSLLNLLFVQNHEVFKDRNINLRRAFLRGAHLAGARLQKVNLNYAELQGANFAEADLQGANLELQDTRPMSAELQAARLMSAKLQGAHLIGVYLQGARLMGVHLQGANLMDARLQSADLESVHLQGANLAEAHLQCAILIDAHLQGANIRRAHLQCAALDSAHLQGADLAYAYLQCATLTRTQLQGIDSDIAREKPPGVTSFENKIRQGIGKEGDLSRIIFSGLLNRKYVNSIVESIPDGERGDECKERLRKQLMLHVDKPASHELPQNSGAITGSYTKEESEEWIAEYNEAMSI